MEHNGVTGGFIEKLDIVTDFDIGYCICFCVWFLGVLEVFPGKRNWYKFRNAPRYLACSDHSLRGSKISKNQTTQQAQFENQTAKNIKKFF